MLKKKRDRLWVSQGQRCAYCGCVLPWMDATLDHLVPRSKGGSNHINNLRVCCKKCNEAKADWHPEEPI